MEEDEQVYLVDFGAVQDSDAKEGGTFTVVGTYGYTPIEQFGGRAVRASDLYALGATLIHLLAGIAPADLPQKDFRLHFSDKVSVSPGFVSWLEKLTEPSLERRFSSVEQTLEALANPSPENQTNLRRRSFYLGEKVQRPGNTQVEIDKSFSHLEIEIKALGKIKYQISTFVALYLIIVGGFSFLAAFSSPISIIVVLFSITPLVANAIGYYFGSTKINLDCESLEIKRQVFEISYLEHKEFTSHIQDIYVTYNGKGKGITIAFGSYLNHFVKHSFGRTLREVELIWLAQEIRDWLELQQQQEAKR